MAEQLKPRPETDRSKWGEAIAHYNAVMENIEEERSNLNSTATSEREALKALGINVKAVDAARHYAKTKEKQREAFDESYKVAREQVGAPIQAELFTTDPEPPASNGKGRTPNKSTTQLHPVN
ncbi:MAG: hypothetical protein GC201_01125 [Alphaproteobacteria bacterium]|nr:hypothetical protein [Alphaproteobacteria bacterium]